MLQAWRCYIGQNMSGYAVASMSDCVCCTHCWKSLGEGALWKKR